MCPRLMIIITIDMFEALDSFGYEFTAPLCVWIHQSLLMRQDLCTLGLGFAFHNPIPFGCSRSGDACLNKRWTDTAPPSPFLTPSLTPLSLGLAEY